MRGCESDPGFMILCIRDIMEWIEAHTEKEYTLRVAYLEVYNEEINDLLGPNGSPASKNLRIVSEDAARGAVIGGLIEEVVRTPDDFMEVLQRGEASRSYASTSMNAESSRSHTIYRVSIERRDRDIGNSTEEDGLLRPNDASSPTTTSYLNLVDLAGSERQKSTNATGKTLKEGSNINKSLLALGAVINKLGEASKKVKGSKPVFIPYRDSKLTRILKQSLGGNTLTSILCAVTPAPMHREETVSTLKFGQLCKTIKNSVKSNEVTDDRALIKQLRAYICELKEQLEGNDGGSRSFTYAELLSQKEELETRVHSLELALNSSDGDYFEDTQLERTSQQGHIATEVNIRHTGKMAALLQELQRAKAELSKQNEKVLEQQRRIVSLESKMTEIADLEEAKSSFEDYQRESAQELEDEKAKLEKEKQTLQTDRYKILNERTAIEEKESRLGTLVTNLDERDSKLRQLLSTLKEQQDQWHRSIADLQRREELVDDWQRNHKQKEQRLNDKERDWDLKFAELNARESTLSELETKFKLQQRELQEREQRLQVALSRVANAEQASAAEEERLRIYEATLKKREGDCDMKERELLSRRKEMESWDTLLREKDRKLVGELKGIEEREEACRLIEEKARNRDIEAERMAMELRRNTASIQEQVNHNSQLINAIEAREKESFMKEKKVKLLEEQLALKETELRNWQQQLAIMEERLSDVEEREAHVNARMEQHKVVEDDFYNVRAAEITARHSKQLSELETVVSQQLKVISNFQSELDNMRSELSVRCLQNQELEILLQQRTNSLERLRSDYLLLEEAKERAEKAAIIAQKENSLTQLLNTSSDRVTNCDDDEEDDFSITSSSSGLPSSSRLRGQSGGNQVLILQLADSQRVIERLFDSPSSRRQFPHTIDDTSVIGISSNSPLPPERMEDISSTTSRYDESLPSEYVQSGNSRDALLPTEIEVKSEAHSSTPIPSPPPNKQLIHTNPQQPIKADLGAFRQRQVSQPQLKRKDVINAPSGARLSMHPKSNTTSKTDSSRMSSINYTNFQDKKSVPLVKVPLGLNSKSLYKQ